MRVLHVTPWYEPAWKTGGTAVAVSRLCQSLADRGVDVTVYTTNDDGEGGSLDLPTGERLMRDGVAVEYYQCDFWLPSKRSFSASGLNARLAETISDFDVVHVASTRHQFERTIHRLCTTHDIPYIVSPHASLMEWWMSNIGRPLLKKTYMSFVGREVLNDASAIHFLSDVERRRSEQYTGDAPSFVVPNGIEVSEFAQPSIDDTERRLVFGLPSDELLLLHLGRIHPQKNVRLTVKAVGELTERGIPVNFLVVGPVSDTEYYESLVELVEELGVQNRVRIHPPVPRSQLKEVYSLADLLVLPSKVEGISMTMIEAMARSLPALVSDRIGNAGDIEEYDAGFVVEPETEELVTVLERLSTDPERVEAVSENAATLAAEVYDIERVAKQMERAYRDVVDRTHSDGLQWQGCRR